VPDGSVFGLVDFLFLFYHKVILCLSLQACVVEKSERGLCFSLFFFYRLEIALVLADIFIIFSYSKYVKRNILKMGIKVVF